MIHLYSGDGKGKTTAAIGCAVRMAGYGRNVLIIQFLKGRHTGEIEGLSHIPGVELKRNTRDYGFYSKLDEDDKEKVRNDHNDNIQYALQAAKSKSISMLILDELCDAYSIGCLDRHKVEDIVSECKKNDIELIITGHKIDDYFIQIADYHTNMTKIKHPYDNGITSRECIEY